MTDLEHLLRERSLPPRQTGSAFVINLLIETTAWSCSQATRSRSTRLATTAAKQRTFRCSTCHVAVFSQYTRPQVWFVRGGTLDDPSSIMPDVHIFTRSKLGWTTLPESVPAFEVYYDTKALWPAASLERLEAILAPPNSDA
jgi:hypothetical protein